MPRPTDTRDQIQAAALRVFARKGYRDAVVEDVAAEAGVSKGTIYTYFDRKEELLGAVFERLMAEMEARHADVMQSHRPPLEKIRLLLCDFIDLFASEENLARAVLDLWIAGMRDPDRFGIDFAALNREYRQRLADLLREARERGDVPEDLPSVTPAVLMGAADGVFLQWLLDPEAVDFPGSADALVDVLYRGIRTSANA